jgi:hypothetical protein
LKCNEREGAELSKHNLLEAYGHLKMGMLGTGESEYSILLTRYFNECLEHFCANEKVEDHIDELRLYVRVIANLVIIPKYCLLRLTLLYLVRESERAKDFTSAIRFQKEMIFFHHA